MKKRITTASRQVPRKDYRIGLLGEEVLGANALDLALLLEFHQVAFRYAEAHERLDARILE